MEANSWARRWSITTYTKLRTFSSAPIGSISRRITARLREGATAGEFKAFCRTADPRIRSCTARNCDSTWAGSAFDPGAVTTSTRARAYLAETTESILVLGPRVLGCLALEIAHETVHQRRLGGAVHARTETFFGQTQRELRGELLELAAHGFPHGVDLHRGVLFHFLELRGCFPADTVAFLLHLGRRLHAEAFDVGAQRAQARVHFGRAPFRVLFHPLRFGDALLDFPGARSEQRG